MQELISYTSAPDADDVWPTLLSLQISYTLHHTVANFKIYTILLIYHRNNICFSVRLWRGACLVRCSVYSLRQVVYRPPPCVLQHAMLMGETVGCRRRSGEAGRCDLYTAIPPSCYISLTLHVWLSPSLYVSVTFPCRLHFSGGWTLQVGGQRCGCRETVCKKSKTPPQRAA